MNDFDFKKFNSDQIAHSKFIKKKLYRVFRLGRFLEMVDKRQNTLVRPAMWGDPWEEWWSKTLLKKTREALPPVVFGQCWSIVDESDAMWRVYSPNGDGIKVCTKYNDLLDPLYNRNTIYSNFRVVEYKTDIWLRKLANEFLKTTNKFKSSKDQNPPKYFRDDGSKDMLLIAARLIEYEFKRSAFQWEQEGRLLVLSPQKLGEVIFSYPIDPKKFFHEIVFDPRMDESLCKMVKSHLIKKGIKCPIRKSSLYTLDI